MFFFIVKPSRRSQNPNISSSSLHWSPSGNIACVWQPHHICIVVVADLPTLPRSSPAVILNLGHQSESLDGLVKEFLDLIERDNNVEGLTSQPCSLVFQLCHDSLPSDCVDRLYFELVDCIKSFIRNKQWTKGIRLRIYFVEDSQFEASGCKFEGNEVEGPFWKNQYWYEP